MAVNVVNKKTKIIRNQKRKNQNLKQFKGAAHSMVDDAKKQDVNESFDDVQAEKIKCNDSKPNTRIQIILIGGKRTLKVTPITLCCRFMLMLKQSLDIMESFL
eukprot:TRINITY_DN12611_c0_g1_i1.p1 TRINITY_DN12611_c0_g1~~TRINITY_DN12611_c0_g1_i1.p1  ORF type:complete len:103 (+),score=10.30 TRINITY_DN12611_c0_g1_i1:317-625(+)